LVSPIPKRGFNRLESLTLCGPREPPFCVGGSNCISLWPTNQFIVTNFRKHSLEIVTVGPSVVQPPNVLIDAGLISQSFYRIKGDPAGAEAALVAWGL
jgi:hypothetical protein